MTIIEKIYVIRILNGVENQYIHTLIYTIVQPYVTISNLIISISVKVEKIGS